MADLMPCAPPLEPRVAVRTSWGPPREGSRLLCMGLIPARGARSMRLVTLRSSLLLAIAAAAATIRLRGSPAPPEPCPAAEPPQPVHRLRERELPQSGPVALPSGAAGRLLRRSRGHRAPARRLPRRAARRSGAGHRRRRLLLRLPDGGPSHVARQPRRLLRPRADDAHDDRPGRALPDDLPPVRPALPPDHLRLVLPDRRQPAPLSRGRRLGRGRRVPPLHGAVQPRSQDRPHRPLAGRRDGHRAPQALLRR